MLIASLVIASVAIIGMFVVLFACPEVHIRKFSLQTFFVPILLGALLIMALGFVDYQDLWHSLISADGINPLEILVLFLSMSFISVVLDEAGFFSYIADLASQKAKHNQFILFLILYILTSILTVFTSNDIVILTFTPFLIFFAKNAKINPVPYLVSEFVAANSWSMLLVIGNPTNIYLATSFGITFFAYVGQMVLPTIFAGVISFLLMYFMFRKMLRVPFNNEEHHPQLKDKFLATLALIILLTTIVAMAFANFFDIQIWLVSLGGAVLLLLSTMVSGLAKHPEYSSLKASFRRLPYPVIPFILSMFVIVMSLKYVGVIAQLGDFFSAGNPYFRVGVSSFLATNFLNNIPMSELYTAIFRSMNNVTPTMIYLAIISSNLGAFFTPVGALAGVMWMGILKRYQLKFTIVDFVHYLSLISVVTLIAAFLGLYLNG